MKILFVAPLEKPESTAWLILKAMRNFNLDVEPFSYREIAKFESPAVMNDKLKEKIESMSWKDLVFVIKGEAIYPLVFKNGKPRKILWWFDFDSFTLPERLIQWASYFDTVFLMCYPWVEGLRNLGIRTFFMPQATDPSVYHPVEPDPKYKCDVAFIGSRKPGREELLAQLRDYNVQAFGNGWTNGPVYLEEFNKVCSSAKVVLNITPSDNWPIYPRTFSQRIYMAMSAGGYVVTDNIPDIPLRWLGVYDNISHLKDIIELAVHTENLRKNACERAREEIIRNHTYYHRIKEIFACLGLSLSVRHHTLA